VLNFFQSDPAPKIPIKPHLIFFNRTLPENFLSNLDFKISINPATPAWKFFIANTIASGNCFRINQTLIFIFQSRSLLRAINQKIQTGKISFSDVNTHYFFNHTHL